MQLRRLCRKKEKGKQRVEKGYGEKSGIKPAKYMKQRQASRDTGCKCGGRISNGSRDWTYGDPSPPRHRPLWRLLPKELAPQSPRGLKKKVANGHGHKGTMEEQSHIFLRSGEKARKNRLLTRPLIDPKQEVFRNPRKDQQPPEQKGDPFPLPAGKWKLSQCRRGAPGTAAYLSLPEKDAYLSGQSGEELESI